LNCHIPALNDLPRDSWSCGLCVEIGQETRNNASTLLSCGQKRRYSKEITDWQYKLCEKVLLCLSVHADSLPFHHKVSKVQVPDYYKVITNPMDLMTVRSKLSPQHFESYRSLQDFFVDIRLIFKNCFIYNSPDSDVCKMGVRLEKYFDGLLKKYVPDSDACNDKTTSGTQHQQHQSQHQQQQQQQQQSHQQQQQQPQQQQPQQQQPQQQQQHQHQPMKRLKEDNLFA
jgi:hypothetical protein